MIWKLLFFFFGILYLSKCGTSEYSRQINDLIDISVNEEFEYDYDDFWKTVGQIQQPEVTVIPLSPCSLFVNWTSIENVTEYTISWAEAETPEDAQNSTVVNSIQHYKINDLTADTSYEVFVTAFLLDGKESESDHQVSNTSVGEPPNIKSLQASDAMSSRITIKWVAEESQCKPEFKITWEAFVYWDPDRTSIGGDTTYEMEYIMSNLIPDSNYTIYINAFSTDGLEGEESCTTSKTFEGEPGPPVNLNAEALTNSEISVSWNEPPELNGILGPYTMDWILNAEDSKSNSTQTNDTSAEIANLFACGNYNISVHASTEGGEGEPIFTDVTTLPEVPPPVTHLKAGNIKAHSVDLTWTTPDTLCPIREYTLNGTGVVLWGEKETVLVESITINGSTNVYTVTDLTPYTAYDLLLTPETDGGIGDGSTVKLQTIEDVPAEPQNLTVVQDSIKTKSVQITWEAPDITNGILTEFTVKWNGHKQTQSYVPDQKTYRMELSGFKKNTKYNVNVTASTSIGEGNPAMTNLKTKNNTAAIVLGILIPCIVIGGLLATAFIYRDDIKRKMDTMSRTNPSTDYEELSELNVAPIPLNQLRAYVNKLETGNTLSNEFSTIGARSYKGTTSEGDRPQNQDKNRYANILPYDVTRVSLKGRNALYINANYIASSKEPKFFIAAQGPKDTTLEDFWDMVWQENVDLIVMLTLCNEGGKDKCCQYWPRPLGYGTDLGNFSIHNINEESTTLLTVRMIEVTYKKDNTKRLIKHYQYMSWPDFGAPSSSEDLLNVLSNVKRNLGSTRRDRNKMLVHCSAGVGRTGTFIALWNLIEQIESGKDSVSVTSEVLNLRKQRMIMVQSKEQYLYLYKCIVEYYENKSRWHMKMGESSPGYESANNESGVAFYNNASFDPDPVQEFQGNLI